MALQNLDISDTLLAIGNFVKNDAAVQEFCENHFENISIHAPLARCDRSA